MKKWILFLAMLFCALFWAMKKDVREARIISRLTVTENLASPVTTSYWEINGLDETKTYRDGGTRNDVDNVWSDTLINDGTIDLTSLTGTLGNSLDLTDEVIIAAKFSLEDDAGAYVDISEGASNGFPLMGASFTFRLYANQSILLIADTVLTPVASADRTIDYDSSNDSTVLSVILITADSYQ